ncbi:MAG: 1-deoxy-D-xylulose-5-phosphate reductoisomerase [Treponema sp.]|jgi:1-deoxy-D-xylulose-5-phosphate reductoisomerase|nr:1-deoxy-D-xylulose-5-phosphate reductoisomerase [Treponema sp.]
MKKRIAVLGATGSIGKSSLDIISRNSESFEVVLLSAHSRCHELEQLKNKWHGAVCVLSGEVSSSCEKNGKEKLLDAIGDIKPDITVNGISGSAGLEPSLAAIEAGSSLALANKETVVMAGQLAFRLAREKNVKIIPVDSEHSAIFHLIEAHTAAAPDGHNEEIAEIILTASGGPFRKLSRKEMESVTVKDALAHPTWNMGKKITIDSATMANKGLEIIEACSFFNMPAEKIKVVVHPQSIVHSMIRLCNGVFYAQLSKPDMRHPIHDALFWPKTAPLNLDTLNFDSLTLEFEKPDLEKFPMLSLAQEAAKRGGLYPCAYNAANEEAVCAFLSQKIGFLDIPEITEYVMERDWALHYNDKETVLKADTDARLEAVKFIKKRLS